MKKLFILFLSCILVLITNFALWFYHTRVINNILSSIKENLPEHGVIISYDEVLFSTFRCWNVKGSIDNFSIALVNKDKNNPLKMEYALDKLYFESQPFNSKLILHSGADKRVWKTITSIDNTLLSSPSTLEVKNADPYVEVLEIDFTDSISQMLKIGSSKNKSDSSILELSGIVKKLSYQNQNITYVDVENSLEYSYIKDLVVNYDNALTNNDHKYKLHVNLNGLRFNHDYPFNNELSRIYHDFSFFEPEGITVNVDFTLDQYQSPTQIEFYKKANPKKNIELTTIFDSTRFHINDISYHSKVLNLVTKGDLEYENADSSANINIQFDNYKFFFDNFIKSYNYRIANEPQTMSFGLKEIEAQDYKHIEDYLAQFANNDSLVFNITKKREEPNFMVSERDAKTVFYDFLKVVYLATQKMQPLPHTTEPIKHKGHKKDKAVSLTK